MRLRWLLCLSLILLPLAVAWAQNPAVPPMPSTEISEISWMEIIAMAINTVGTMVALKLLAMAKPMLRDKVPDLVPILAWIMGPILAMAQTKLSDLTGFPIDLSPILGAFTGGASMALTMYSLQRRRRLAALATVAPTALARDLAPI